VKNFSEKKLALGWPLEFRVGYGYVEDGTNEFKVGFVKGDKFITMAILIYELGHLNQANLNPRIKEIDQNKEHGRYIETLERDAEKRGWSRAVEYCPEIINGLEEEFQRLKAQGSLNSYSSFEDLYHKLNDCFVAIDNAINSIPEEIVESETEDAECEALKKVRVPEFFAEMEKNKIGERVDVEFAKNFIMKVAKRIAQEN